MKLTLLPPAVVEGVESLLRGRPDTLVVGLTDRDGLVAGELATEKGAIRFELDPADALRIALAFKQHAELAAQQRADAVRRGA